MFVIFDTVVGYYALPKSAPTNWTAKQDQAEQFTTIELAEKRINDFVGKRRRYKVCRVVSQAASDTEAWQQTAKVDPLNVFLDQVESDPCVSFQDIQALRVKLTAEANRATKLGTEYQIAVHNARQALIVLARFH